MNFRFPPIYAVNEQLTSGIVQQIIEAELTTEVQIEEYSEDRVKGYLITSIPRFTEPVFATLYPKNAPPNFDKVLRVRFVGPEGDQVLQATQWFRHPQLVKVLDESFDFQTHLEEVRSSWDNAFSFVRENPDIDLQGLRPPQIGAIHAIHSHWTVSEQDATIVMPTGTGKTETMLSMLVSQQCKKLLVVVPTDALRTQIANKFLTLGILRTLTAISDQARNPIVGILKARPKTRSEVDLFFEKCHVIVTTMSIVGQCLPEVQQQMVEHCPYLFIDEAHHIAAETWKAFKRIFSPARIIQFTATPFRNDNKPVGGKIIYNYPLRKAQEEGYFKPIRYKPVAEFDQRKRDGAIARQAVLQLREDLQQNFDHIVMARVNSIARAEEVFKVYEQYAEFNPVQIHTGLSKTERERVRHQIVNKATRIVVCVDMLGEGFDLPELKIAAFHDIRKSLAVTLQLAGRFTRSKSNLGDPTFIANSVDINVQDELRRLYSQDADWNTLLRQSSEKVIQEQIDLWAFIEGFHDFPDEIPLQNLRPAMSTVVYRTKCKEWMPDQFLEGFSDINSMERLCHGINPEENTLIIVTARKVAIDWAQIKDIFNWDWELYILFWDQEQNLLFINSSGNSGYYRALAEAVAGEDIELIKGPPVFRCFGGVNRLKLQNVGLLQQLGRLIRFTMRAGSDVEPGLTEAQRRNTIKSNIFGAGFELGNKTSVGCSYKGRIWSQRVTTVQGLIQWCRLIGRKVTDETIDPEEVLKGTLVPVLVSERPLKMPITIEWPEQIYHEVESVFEFVVDAEAIPLYETELVLKEPSQDGELLFELCSTTMKVVFKLEIFKKNDTFDYRLKIIGDHRVTIKRGVSQMPLDKYFYDNPPLIWFADGSALAGNSYTELKRRTNPYSLDKIVAWDWTGTDITKESQGIAKEASSVQRRVIESLLQRNYTIVFDDDDPGEAADVIAVRLTPEEITVQFYHCKFSHGDKPGGRVSDLYEVCGQAQKSIHWKEKITDLFYHLLRRDASRLDKRGVGRLEVGSTHEIQTIAEMSRILPTHIEIFVVQPGVSKSLASVEQLELLSVTENHLMETYMLPFGIIASP